MKMIMQKKWNFLTGYGMRNLRAKKGKNMQRNLRKKQTRFLSLDSYTEGGDRLVVQQLQRRTVTRGEIEVFYARMRDPKPNKNLMDYMLDWFKELGIEVKEKKDEPS